MMRLSRRRVMFFRPGYFAIIVLLLATSHPLSVQAFEPAFQDLSMERLLSRAREYQTAPLTRTLAPKSSDTRKHNRITMGQETARATLKKTFPTQVLPPLQIEHIVGKLASHRPFEPSPASIQGASSLGYSAVEGEKDLSTVSRIIALGGSPSSTRLAKATLSPGVKAKALLCLDCGSNGVLLEQNSSQPLPIASITKLVTAMIVVDEMNLDDICEVPQDIKKVEKHVVGLRAGDLVTVRDLLHGLLIESGNDCAEVLARAYPKGGRTGFLAAMKKKVQQMGATRTKLYTPSGLDVRMHAGNTGANEHIAKLSNTASAQDVAIIARQAFSYPLIRHITGMKTYTFKTLNEKPREYRLVSNDKLLEKGLPLEGAKTGYTDAAGKCIVALFKDRGGERLVVVLNTQRHFNAAEKIFRWVSQTQK